MLASPEQSKSEKSPQEMALLFDANGVVALRNIVDYRFAQGPMDADRHHPDINYSKEEVEAVVNGLEPILENNPEGLEIAGRTPVEVIAELTIEAARSKDKSVRESAEQLLELEAIQVLANEVGEVDANASANVAEPIDSALNQPDILKSNLDVRPLLREIKKYTPEAEQARQTVNNQLVEANDGPLSPHDRVIIQGLTPEEAVTTLRAKQEASVYRHIGGKVVETAVNVVEHRVKPALFDVADHMRNPEDEGKPIVVSLHSKGDLEVVIDSLEQKYGDNHPLVREKPLISGDPRNLLVQMAKLEKNPEHEVEIHGKDAKAILAVLEPMADKAAHKLENGETIKAGPDTDEYIALEIVKRSEKETQAVRRAKQHNPDNNKHGGGKRLHPQPT